MNAEDLKEADILWADYVFISAMAIQRNSVREIVEKCKKLGRKTVGGGPLFTTEYEEFEEIDHLVLNEAEVTLPPFLRDIERGSAKHIYKTEEFADVTKTPPPLWSLIDIRKYATMNIQYSRGCPYDCDFCDITILYGRKPRTKRKEQIIEELEGLYRRGWRGGIFFVDDNFIGNKKSLKEEMLPVLINWMKEKKYPFTFFTEVSINLADDEELMRMMVEAGFNKVFVGIESPNEESLKECSKFQNRNRDLLNSVRKIQKNGLQVQGGFIVGFDSDPPSIFEKQIEFIQKSGIVTAMVGLLNAPKGTKLYKRLKKENRILREISGDNTDFSINFIPKMGYEKLIKGYKKIIETIYSPRFYFQRAKIFLKNYKKISKNPIRIDFSHLKAFFQSLWVIGVKEKSRRHYWKLLLWTLIRRPSLLPLAVSFAIYWFHFKRVFEGKIEI